MNFNIWFKENKHELEDLLHGDMEDLLYKAWLAGYQAGGQSIAEKLIPIYV